MCCLSGKTGVGITCSFVKSSLMITCFDKRKNDGHIEIPDLITPGRWHFLCITHTHRQFRGSKLDVFLNAELRQSVKLTYPNTALMAPVFKSLIGMREGHGNTSLRVLLGPISLFGQVLPTNIITNIKSVDEYDALVFQFNSYISSSTTSSGTAAMTTSGPSNGSMNSNDGLLIAYDARNCDRLKGICYDSSGNDHHAAAASAGVRLRHAGTFKQAVAQLGGPVIWLPLLVASVAPSSSTSVSALPENTSVATLQFDEDHDFLSQMNDMLARPLGVRCIPKVVLLVAEMMRHSLVNKFIFRRNHGVRLMALLIRTLPPKYLTADLLTAIERLRSAVISDRTLSDEISRFLLYNFRVWVNAPIELQESVFDKLEVTTRKDPTSSSALSTRHYLRCLSWIYWKEAHGTSLRRAVEYSPEEIDLLRKRVLAMLKIVLCEAQPDKAPASGSIISRTAAPKGKDTKSHLSYECTRSLIFCMIGKPSNSAVPKQTHDGPPVLQDSGEPSTGTSVVKNPAEGEIDAGLIVENVPIADLSDLILLLIELSVQPTAPAGLLDLFGKLGGLRIWLPLLDFPNDILRVMTLRLLRTYLFVKCGCTQDREKATSPDKVHLSVGDAYMIVQALNPEEHPISMGVYSELLLMIMGVEVAENDMNKLTGRSEAFDTLIDDEVLASVTIWHVNMVFPVLELVRSSSASIRMVAIRHLKIIFASPSFASAVNRHALIFSSMSSGGATSVASAITEPTPIIEAILSLRGVQECPGNPPDSLFGVPLVGNPGVPMSQLRELVLNQSESDEKRINALYSIIGLDDLDFLQTLLVLPGDGERKKQVNSDCFKNMSNRMKLSLFELTAMMQPSGCVEFITESSYEIISSIICLEANTNELAWLLLQDPFTNVSRLVASPIEAEVVVVSLLKGTLDKMNEMLSVERNLRISQEAPSRDSILWRNAENLASLSAAVVLHYDPDTLGKVDPTKVSADDEANSAHMYWRCERTIWHESELVDTILGTWQHFTSYFHVDTDASFGRRASSASRYPNGSRGSENNGAQSPPPLSAQSASSRQVTTSRDSSSTNRNSAGKISFGFSAPTGTTAQAPVTVSGPTISVRPHPGGPMRQVLQLLLRCFYLVLVADSEKPADKDADNADSESAQLRMPPNTVFFKHINKLEYFINAMGLGRDVTQFESSFAPSRAGSSAPGGPGLVNSSDCVKAAPGDETSLLLWIIPELALLINRARRKFWSDSAVKLAGILASLVPVPLRSSDDLAKLLGKNDFAANNQEVRRRDGFFHEQMAHAREGRTTKRLILITQEADRRSMSKAELDRIQLSTRDKASVLDPNEETGEVWWQRVKSKDIEDWMKLRVLLKWGIRHVWETDQIDQAQAAVDAMFLLPEESNQIVGEISQDNAFWQLDTYTSSNWIRCRLVPDTDDTVSSEYDVASALGLKSGQTFYEALSLPSVSTMVVDATKIRDNDLDQYTIEQAYEEDEDVNRGSFIDDEQSLIDMEERSTDDQIQPQLQTHLSGSDSNEDLLGAQAITDPSLTNSLRDVDLEFDANMVTAEQQELEPLPPSMKNRRVSEADAVVSVRAAKDTMSRISNISSRFSSGILRLAGSRGSSELDSVAESDAGSTDLSLPTISEAPAALTVDTDTDRNSTSEGNASQPVASDATAPTTPSNGVVATITPTQRCRPNVQEQWRNLSATYKTNAYLVLPFGVMVYGQLRIGVTSIVFEGDYVCTLKDLSDSGMAAPSVRKAYVAQLKRRVWGVRVIRVIHRRRFLLDGQNGLEIYFVDGSSSLLGFENCDEADVVYATLKDRKPPCLVKWGKRLLTAERMFGKSKWTEMWMRREISNFEYLMQLNASAGRSYNDITQYPIFPWVLQDYESSELHLDDPKVYRDLKRPIGAQSRLAQQYAEANYKASDPSGKLPPYHYSTPSSHMRSVLYFLLRLAPFTGAALASRQYVRDGGQTSYSIGTFDSIDEAFQKCTTEEGHSFELPPEFFFLPDFLVSDRNKILAKELVDDEASSGPRRNVFLPKWALSPYDFIRQHRLALESDYVSENLHHWIDLIFGCKQSGPSAVDAFNVYHVACYPERLDVKNLNIGSRSKLTQRGTVPLQLFRKPHPARMSQDVSLEARYPASHAVATLSSRRQVRRHDLPSKHTTAITSIRFSNVVTHGLGLSGPGLGSGNGIGTHSTGNNDNGSVVYTTDSTGVVLAKRYLKAVPDQPRVCPFTLSDVDQWWKLPAGCVASDGVVFYEQMISFGYWDGSWRIHWSADGELLQRIAFHKKPILCMARSEDDFTGDMALAFGSEDCTVSVWALSKMAATRSRRMFVKKDLPVGGLPWVLLYGHKSPVVTVALNVDLDFVASTSKDNTVLLHSLRSSTPLHKIAIASPAHSIVAHLEISPHGDALIHAISEIDKTPSRYMSRALSVTGESSKSMMTGDNSSPVTQNKKQQSELYLVSINGRLISHDKLVNADENPHLLLERGVLFTRSGEYIITATGGADAAIEVRDAGMPSSVVRRIECKRTSDLTGIGMSQDERCILCGYEDGSVVAYAFHFGISDGCKSMVGLDKRAREEEAEAFARANKQNLLKKESTRKDDLFQFIRGGGSSENGGLWIKQGKSAMPAEPFLTFMEERFALLKQPCVSGEESYEASLKQLWTAIYSKHSFNSPTDIEASLMDLSVDAPNEIEYERVGESWSRLGFQRPDPTTDFRAGGMLSLQCLVYFASNYTKQAVEMVTCQVPGSHDNSYPWGPAGINVTCMVARLFWKFDGHLVRERQSNWPLFGNTNAFYLIFSEGKPWLNSLLLMVCSPDSCTSFSL